MDMDMNFDADLEKKNFKWSDWKMKCLLSLCYWPRELTKLISVITGKITGMILFSHFILVILSVI